MKKTLLAIALTLGFCVAASAADLSSVGTTGVEATVDYTYARSTTADWLSQHTAIIGAQFNMGDAGSVSVGAGDTLNVTSYNQNYTTLVAGYSNGFKLGSLGIVGNATFENASGNNKWIGGHDAANISRTLTGTIEATLPVTSGIKAFADVGHTVVWSPNEFATGTNSDNFAVGAYVDVTQSLTVKAGYVHSWSGNDFNGALVSVAFKL